MNRIKTQRTDPAMAMGLAVMTVLAIALGGCRPPDGPTLDHVESNYHQQHYRQARQEALELRVTLSGEQRDRASYYAGLCSYRLNDYAQAETLLGPLVHSNDRSIAGRSAATLGMIYLDRGLDQRALDAFRTATAKLQGNDAAQCYFYIGVIEQKMGWWTSARSHLDIALRQATDEKLRHMIRQRQSYHAFALQGGAYRNKRTADQRARLLAPAGVKAGLPAPRVVPSTSAHGGRLYLVQIGRFADFAHAQRARHKMASEEVIIVPVR